MKAERSFKLSFITIIIAMVLWYLMFIIKPINFWLEMSLSISALVILGLFIKKDLLKLEKITARQITVGILSFILLYVIFYFGNIISGYIFPFKNAQISMVYGNKAQGSLYMIGTLLLLVIGPGEEIFWRGFIQNTFAKRLGETRGYIIASLVYCGVHIITGNFMLVLAALVCGLFWGWFYKKEKSLWTVVISHALWDLTIFVLLPVK